MTTDSDEDKQLRIDAIYEKSRASFSAVPEMTVDELRSLQSKENVVLVDVRTPDEQVVSMIPGAITASDFKNNQHLHKDATIVTYCTVGGRSGMFAKELHAAGMKVFNLKGAILAWTHGGGDLIDAEGSTRRVHVHGRKFDLLATGYEPVY